MEIIEKTPQIIEDNLDKFLDSFVTYYNHYTNNPIMAMAPSGQSVTFPSVDDAAERISKKWNLTKKNTRRGILRAAKKNVLYKGLRWTLKD